MKRSDRNIFKNALVSFVTSQLLLGMLLFPNAGHSASVMVDWDPSTDADIAGYKIYYQPNAATMPFQGTGAAEGSAPIDVANTNSATITGLEPANSYYFAVTAYNTAGVESAYSNIVEISESLPPVVNLTPPPNTTVSGTVALAATATDNVGVTSVEFYVNDVLQSTVNAAPYTFNWDTTALSSGSYTVVAKAYDAAGNVGQSGNLVLNVPGDITPPTVSVTAPGTNVTVKGSIAVTASATDDTKVVKIELYDNGSMIFASNDSSVNYTWNTAASANGLHVLSAKAYDAAGNVGDSANVGVIVANDLAAPSVSISSPTAGGTVSGSVSVATTATDNVGVAKVEFYVNGVLKGTDTAAPYNFNWNSTSMANGTYTLTAKAYDAAGNVGQSAGVSVKVSNAITTDTTAPTVTIQAPTSSYLYTSSMSISASATDNVRVTKIELYVDNALKYTTTSSSFNINWNMAMGVHTISVKAYDGANNVSVASKTVNRFL